MRTQIGFKVTDNKVTVFEDSKCETEITPLTPQDEAIFKIAHTLHKMMENRSTGFKKSEPFFDVEGEKLIPLINKVYTRYYEKF